MDLQVAGTQNGKNQHIDATKTHGFAIPLALGIRGSLWFCGLLGPGTLGSFHGSGRVMSFENQG